MRKKYFPTFIASNVYPDRKKKKKKMFEKGIEVLDKCGSCGALLVDLSKAFNCIAHDCLPE